MPFPHLIQHNCIFSLNHIFFFTFNFGNEYVHVHMCHEVCTSEGNLWEAVLPLHHVHAFWGPKSGCQAWWQVPLPGESSFWSTKKIIFTLLFCHKMNTREKVGFGKKELSGSDLLSCDPQIHKP